MISQIVIFLCIGLNFVYGKDTRIIGGVEANQQEFPYHASLRRISNDEHICGGAIVSTNHILTVAHCVDINFVLYSDLKIRIGIARSNSLKGATHLPDRIFTHPKYTGKPNSVTFSLYDIAIIRVKVPIEFNNMQKKINLPSKQVDNESIAVVSGWGAIGNPTTNLANKLQVSWMTVLDRDHCQNKLPFELHSDHICAFQKPGVGVCNGDGGSPLVSNGKLIGLVVASRPYATGDPELYTDVYKHIDFIKSIVK